MGKIGVVFLILLLVSSCIVDVDIELKSGNDLVLNGVIVPGEPVLVYLNRSRVGYDSLGFESVNDADVKLTINNEINENLTPQGEGLYMSSIIAQELTNYRIDVATNDGEELWAVTTTPAILSNVTILSNWEIDSTRRYYWPYYISIVDNPLYSNNYWICDLLTEMQHDSTFRYDLAYVLSTSSLLTDKFNTTYDPEDTSYPYDYDYFIHFDDTDFQGDTLYFDLVTPRSYITRDSVLIYNMDEHYSNYLKSKIIAEQNPDYLTEHGPPVNYTPSFLYSNVHGGVGILGSYTCYSKVYNY